MRQWTGQALMACRLFGTEPLPEPIPPCCKLDSWEQISMKFESKLYHFQMHLTLSHVVYQNGSLFFQHFQLYFLNWKINPYGLIFYVKVHVSFLKTNICYSRHYWPQICRYPCPARGGLILLGVGNICTCFWATECVYWFGLDKRCHR